MTETEIENAREIFKAVRKAHMDALDAKLNEAVEMIQGQKALDEIWLGVPPQDLQSLVQTIRMYRPAPMPVTSFPVYGQPAPMGQV